MKFKPIVVDSIICGLAIVICLVGFEVYLRHTESHIINQHIRQVRTGISVEGDLQSIAKHTPNGKRLISNAHVLIHNHPVSGRDIMININSLGFRDKEIDQNKNNNEIRILILGDSITLGDYIQRDEVYVERIEKYLDLSIKNQHIEVVNGGIGDIGLKEEIDILIEQGLSIRPEIVIIAFYLNDSRPPWGFTGELGARGWLRRHSLLAETIYKNIELRKWVKNKGKDGDRFRWIYELEKLDWHNNRDAFLELASMAEYDWGAAWKEDSWDIIDREFSRLKSLSTKYNFDVAVVIFPVAFQVYANYIDDMPQEIIKEKAHSFGFKHVDLLPLLRSYRNERLFFDHCHPIVKTNDIIGKEIARFIKEEMLPN